MKLILFLLLTSQAWGQDTTSIGQIITAQISPSNEITHKGFKFNKEPDTLAVYVIFQPFPGSAITAKDAYLIKGQLWYRSVAALNKGKWFPFRRGWRVIEIKQSK